MARTSAFSTTYPANADLSSHQYKAMKFVTGGKVALQDSATANSIAGILVNAPTAADQAAEIEYLGPSQGWLAGTTAVGDKLNADANGLLAVVTADKARYFAIATQAGAASEIGRILIVGETYLAA